MRKTSGNRFYFSIMEIFKEDLDNGLDPLPVRQGCSGPCACTGYCRTIIGYIERAKYVDFMASYVSPETFIQGNMEKVDPAKHKREVHFLEVSYSNARPVANLFALQAKKAIGVDKDLAFYKDLMERPFIIDKELVDFVMENRVAFEGFIAIFEGKLKITYKND